MAFDAGAIEATLTLNRNPFTAGLLAAKRQAEDFARKRYTATIDLKVDQRKLMEVEAQLKRLSRQRVQATAKVLVDRLKFDKLLVDLKKFDGKTYSANIDVDTAKATADVIAFRTLLASLNNQTVDLRANTRGFGRDAGNAFDGGSSRFSKMATAIIVALPLIASGFTAAVGAVGALASAFVIAGLGAGAFALVAVPAFKQIGAAVAAGQAEIDKLPPGLRQAGNALQAFNKELGELRKNTQVVTGIALANWFNAGKIALGTLQPLVVASALAFSNAANMAAKFFGSPWWQNFVAFLSRAINPAVDTLFRSLFSLIQIVGNLTRAFWDLGGSQIMEMIAKGLEEFAKWTDHIGQNKTFQAFMDAAVRSLPVVGHLLADLLVFIFKLAIALEPLGTLIIRVLNGIFDAVNSIPPPMLQALAYGFAAVWAAMALGATGPVGIAVGVLAGLAVIFAHVYAENEALKTSLGGLVDFLKSKWQPIWDTIVANFTTYILPAWEHLRTTVEDRLMPALQRFGAVFMEEVWPKIEPFVNEVTGTLIPAVLGFIDTLIGIISFLVDVFGPTVAKEMGNTIQAFTGAFDIISGALNIFTSVYREDWTKFTEGTTQITRGFWTIVAAMFGESFADLRSQVQAWDTWMDSTWTNFWNGVLGFLRGIWNTIGLVFRASLDLMHGDVSAAADKIGQVWRKVANLFATPINWVINNVIGPPGGLAGAWNAVMSWIGAPGLNVQRPQNIPGFNQGGKVRGKGTGTSDENLALVSNGEFIVRENVARRIMPFLEALNHGQAEALRAASSDKAVDDMMMRFAAGGVVGGQAVLNTMRGRPYIWGGGSARGTDCSGIVAMVQRGMAGEANPYRRIGTTSSMPWGGWVGGLTSALTSGVNGRGGGASHMAGTLAGTNFEARQTGTPIYVGGPARGSASFPYKYSLSSAGGQYVGGGAGGGGMAAPPPVSWWSIVADKVMGLFKGLFGGDIPGAGGVIGDAMNNIPRLLVEKVTGVIKTKLEGMMTAAGSAIGVTAQGLNQNPLSGMGTSDRGAIIPPGASTLFNATGRPEPLTNLDVYERMKPAGLTVEDVLALIKAGGGDGGTGGGDTYNVMLPERATVRELADTIDFKRKVVAKGRYVR
jgi:hypothetical protein